MKLNEIDLSKTLFVEHVDFDGLIPFVLNKFFNINYDKSICTNYNEDLEHEHLPNYETVVYVDFTPNENARKIIKENNIYCMILDHHIGTKEEIENFCKEYDKCEYIFDNDRCGTKIYYEWLKEQGYKGNDVSDEIVELTNTYDLYKKERSNWDLADKCNRLLYSTTAWYVLKADPTNRIEAYKFFINSMLWKMQNANNFFFNKIETEKINADIQKENDIFNELIRNSSTEISTRKDCKGKYFAVFNCNSKISAVANKLMEKYKKLDYCIVINAYDENNPKISLRCKDRFNLLELNNTAGHELACGINADTIENMKQFADDLKSKKIYELGYKE